MKVIIIGAGIAGLGAATYFSRNNHDVLILESGNRAGGRAITLRREGCNDIVDVGTQFYHSSYNRAIKLIHGVGLGHTLSKISGYTRIFDSRAAKGSFLINHRLPWYGAAGFYGNLRIGYYILKNLFNIPRDAFSAERHINTDALSALDGPRHEIIYQTIIRPLALIGVLSEPEAMDLSLHHLLRLIRVILMTDYLVLDGGTCALHDALASGFNIQYETPVASVVTESGKVTGVETRGNHQVITADHVVIATTAASACAVLPRGWSQERAFLSSVTAPPFVLPVFFLDRPLEKGVWSYLMQNREDRLISYLTDASRKNPAMVPSGKAIIQAWICFPGSGLLVDKDDNEIAAICLGELEEIFPGFPSWVEHIHITRHPTAVPFHSVGHQDRAIEFLEHADNRGISFCGDYLSGGYMESALWSAQRAARKFA